MSQQLRRKVTMQRHMRHTSKPHLQQAYQWLWKWAQDEHDQQQQEEQHETDGPICTRIHPPASSGSHD